ATVEDSRGEVVLTNAVQRVLFDCSSLPDCDMDGVLDRCQILAEPERDSSGDSVLDTCLPPTTWYVDPAAAPGGSGGIGSPFNTIALAIQAASDGDVI